LLSGKTALPLQMVILSTLERARDYTDFARALFIRLILVGDFSLFIPRSVLPFSTG
jgi:hypothetical protein